MSSSFIYLLSGVSGNASNSVSVIGMEKFSVSLHANRVGNAPATGTLEVNGRLDPSAPYVTIYSNTFTDSGNIITQFDGPLENLQAKLASFSTGTFSIACRYV